MAGTCPVCGEKIGGVFSDGVLKATQVRLEFCKKNGIDVEDGICQQCLEKKIEQILGKNESATKNTFLYNNVENLKVLSSVFLTPSSTPAELQDLGLVTGYCILGTGPLSTLFSSVTDVFGLKSGAYLEKARTAEKEALDMLKLEALKKGADAVYCVRVNLTEATSGNGMLMVSASGAAVKTGKTSEALVAAWKMFAEA